MSMITLYARQNSRVCFLLPTAACGIDEYGDYFFEIAWLFFVVGIGTNGDWQ